MSDVSSRRSTRITRSAAFLACAVVVVAAVATASVAGTHGAVSRSVAPAGARGTSFAQLPWHLSPRAQRLIRQSRVAAAPAGRQTRFSGTPCGDTPGLLCSQVLVPLDRTGRVPGTVSLYVETLPALGTQRGVVFLIAGGPGQGSAHVFGLGSPDAAALYRYMFPGYTLVAYDDRGTGSSGVLRCPGLQNAVAVDFEMGLAAECAASLGQQRDFYSTHEHAEDLEAVRQSLGVDKVALWGTSYGTKLALAYALAHPTHVERLLLDSVVPPERDTYETSLLRALPAALSAYCGNGFCHSATSDFAGDVITVANRLDATPIRLKLLQPNGSRKVVRLSGLGMLSFLIDADLSPGLAAVLPAAVHAARLGSFAPLLRLFQVDTQGMLEPDEDLSAGLYAATVCSDGPFPWQPDTPVGDRPAVLAAAIKALPAGSLGPFGSWAAALGNATFCLQWPVPAGGAALGAGPLPDVPVLAVDGGFDLRTPSADAIDVASRFPQGRVLLVPGVGHNVLGADVSFCSQEAVHNWVLGTQPPSSCARPKPIVDVVPAYPAARQSATRRASPARTLVIVAQSLRDAEAIWSMSSEPGTRVAGLYGGRLTASAQGFTLDRYSVTPGVEVSGKLRVTASGFPYRFSGAVTVGGAAAADGLLGLVADKLAGTLDGRIVRG